MTVATAIMDPEDVVAEGEGPLSAQHERDLSTANQRARKILGAVKVATFNGWSAAVLAGASLLFVWFDLSGIPVGVGLAVVAWNEFRGRDLLRRFDPRGASLLGWNQVGFIGLLVAYSSWCIYTGLTGPDPYETYITDNPQLAPILGSIGDLHATVTLAVYGGVIVLSFIFQGLNALYYFKRGRLLKVYLGQTPAWIVDLQRRSVL
jgi:hypothetical protein